MVPKSTFHSQEYKDMRYTDLGQKLKAFSNIFKVILTMHVLITTVVRHNNLYMVSPHSTVMRNI